MKRTILLIGLGVAFAAVSLWVFLSAGRSAKAVRAKFRIGGAILTIVSLTSLAGCNNGKGAFVSCYDPASPPTNYHRWNNDVPNSEFRNGDKVILKYDCQFGSEVKVSLVTDDMSEDRVLCSQTYEVAKGENQLEFTIEAGDYRGRAELIVEYDKYQDEDDSLWNFGSIFISIVD